MTATRLQSRPGRWPVATAPARPGRRLLLGLVCCAGCGVGAGSSGIDVVDSDSMTAPAISIDTVPQSDGVADTPDRHLTESAGRETDSTTPDDDETIVAPVAARPATVAVVGDSLTVAATQEIERALTGIELDVIAVDALESRRIAHGGDDLPPGTAAVAELLEPDPATREPGLWVIALGTNDVASVGSLDSFQSEMRELLDLIPDDVPVVWVDLWIRDRTESIELANRLIRAELGRRTGGSAVVDWFAHGDDDGVITADGVHLTEAGRALFASSIADTIEQMFPGASQSR